MEKWRQGLKIELGATKERAVLFNLKQEFNPAQPSSSTKNSLSQLFSNFASIQVNKCPLYGEMETAA